MPEPFKTTLLVPFKGTPKMVGKVFRVAAYLSPHRHDPDLWILFHQEIGSQLFYKRDSPGGLDLITLDWLEAHKIDQVHHQSKGDPVLYVASLADFRACVPEQYDGRERVFLPFSQWRKINEGPWYPIPWIPNETVLGADYDRNPRQGAML
jgi:hypothetical protein